MKYFLLFVLSLTVLAFNAEASFRHISTEDGLPSGEINSFAQDNTGNMWFATWSGLIRYDGFRFTNFRPELGNEFSLPSKKVGILLVDSHGYFWIVVEHNLCRYDQRTGKFYTIPFDCDREEDLIISSLAEYDGYLFAQSNKGLYAIPITDEISTEKVSVIPVKLNDKNLSTYFNMISVTNDRLLLINTVDSSHSRMFFATLKNENGTPFIFIEHVIDTEYINSVEYVRRENALYIALLSGVSRFSLAAYSFDKNKFLADKSIRRMIYASNNYLYCASSGANLYYVDLHTGKSGEFAVSSNDPTSLFNSNILSLFEDFSGNLWIGHQGQGISILNLNVKEFHTYRKRPGEEKQLTSNAVMCFGSTQNEAFIGCRTGGLNMLKRSQIDEENAEFEVIPLYGHQGKINSFGAIWDIKRESDSIFWVATDAGLCKLSRIGSEWKFMQYGEDPIFRGSYRSIMIDPNKNLWCGTMRNGIVLIPRSGIKEGLFYHYRYDLQDTSSISNNVILTFLLDSKNRLWVGTNNGLNLLDGRYDNLDLSGKVKPEVHFRRYVAERPTKNYLNNNEINSIYENYDGAIWVATQGGGINVYRPDDDDFSHITMEQGLPSNDVLGILSDDLGNLWISTSRGLVSYNQHIDNATFTRYSSFDGTQGGMFMVNSYHKALDGELYFGGENGFTRFYPYQIKPNTIKPKVSFTNLRISNKVIHVGDTLKGRVILDKQLNATSKIVLPYSKSTLAVGVAAIHFQYPNGNYIGYFLEGYQPYWIIVPASNGYAYFVNLPAGKYKLRVKAISSDNVESAEIKELDIEIEPPWYSTWYMTAIFLVFGILLITWVVYEIINRQREKYLQRIAQMTIENNESKMVFLSNIAHELRTPLSLVLAPIGDLMQNVSKMDEHWQGHLAIIQRNANYLLKLINQIIDFRKMNEGQLKMVRKKVNLVDLVSGVVSNFGAYKGKQRVRVVEQLPNVPVWAMVDVQKIEEILYNLLSNAFKHTEENGSIIVSLEQIPMGESASDHVRIGVFNEGIEIKDEDKQRIFERFFKADETKDGAGIGLSFSKSLIEMHNGTIWVESVQGKGVQFYIQFPIEQEESLATAVTDVLDAPEPELVMETDAPQLSQGEEDREIRIVIVEDNDELRKFLFNVLSRYYSCLEARDGKEAWNLILDMTPDIIISDVVMPQIDGYELCRMVKDDINTCHIPFIMLTAKNSNENVIEGYNSGVDSYVTKPFDIQVILSQISRLIKNRELIRTKYKKQNFMVEVSSTNPSKDDEFLVKVRALLDDNLNNTDFNVKEMAILLEMSTTQLYRKIKTLTGYSPVEFMRIARLHKAHDMLKSQKHSIKEVCYLVGFNNLSYFVKCFREYFGVTPANFRDKGA